MKGVGSVVEDLAETLGVSRGSLSIEDMTDPPFLSLMV